VAVVHLFASSGQFSSFDEMRRFIDQTFSEDGDGIASEFMREAGLDNGYEPSCIEAYWTAATIDVGSLLAGASYGDQWVHLIPPDVTANAAICVFEPNRMRTPENASLTYLGSFPFDEPANSQW
jgi:hypothetical protein